MSAFLGLKGRGVCFSKIFQEVVEMKTLVLWGLVSLLALSGMALAHPSGENEKGSSMQQMQQMMGGESGAKGMSMSGGMMGMMQRMNTMMDQCSTMMNSARGQKHHKQEGEEKS
jgi:hypothetical protein